jgi:hypothetical protein
MVTGLVDVGLPWVRRFVGIGAAMVTIVFALACSSDEDDCSTGTRCTTNDDCDGGSRCVGTECTKLYCVRDGLPCGGDDNVCESKRCASPPGREAVCASGPLADGWSCSSPSACASGYCNTATFKCEKLGSGSGGASCREDKECSAGFFCRTIDCGGGGVGMCSAPVGADEKCCNTSQCSEGLLCRRESCTLAYTYCQSPAPPGETCCSDGDCQPGLTCTPISASLKKCQ